jgi:hypothetical protein
MRLEKTHPILVKPSTRRLLSGWLLVVSCLCGAPPAAAQFVRPWAPPTPDSLLAWSGEAKVRFRSNQGDSAHGPNYRPYELVGRMGRQLLRSLGTGNFSQAHALEAVLDSLGLDTEIALDVTFPDFVLLMVHNPYRPSAASVGFLYWLRGNDLRLQGVTFQGGLKPKMRVWWTTRKKAPYQWAIVFTDRSPEQRLFLMLLRLNESGHFWNLVQYEDNGPDLGARGDAFLVDLNKDNVPEIVSWVRASADSTFEECQGCPYLLTERIFTVREAGYALHDNRLLPSPYASFVLFVRLLREKNRAAASRLLKNPSKLDQAIALGWGARASPGAWKLEYAEEGQPWPRWLAMRFKAGKGRPLYIVRFTMLEGRWIIDDWIEERRPGDRAPAKTGGAGR